MQLFGLEARRTDLARGIVIARAKRPLDSATQRALWEALEVVGVTELDDESEEPEDDEEEPEPERQWLAAPWLPPAPGDVDAHRSALEELGARFELDSIWCVKVETGIDGVAWMELVAAEAQSDRDEEEADDEPAPAEEGSEQKDVVDAIFDEEGEVLYAAPDAPVESGVTGDPETAGAESDGDDDDEDDDDADEDDITGETMLVESHWREGTPPFEHSVPFPIERYPEILDDYDWESFGVAVKLSGDALPGEESVVNAFFALWLSVYQDERAEGFEPFQRADVVHDRRHRSALMWVEKLAVPATSSDQVHFLLWIVAQLHTIIPVAWSRFEDVDDGVKARASSEEHEPLVLAGNPFTDRFERHGEEAALSWAVAQSAWSRRELAGMLVEVALRHDPDDAEPAKIAERLLRRALAFDPTSDATGYLAIVLVRQQRVPEAIALARTAPADDVRLLVVGDTAEHAATQVPETLVLLEPDILERVIADDGAEEISELVAVVARHAPQHIAALLATLPKTSPALVPHLYNASFSVERPEALQILRFVLSLPEPPAASGEARTALVMAWNNACIHAHALGDYDLAVELADGGQKYATENPYIYHSAACAYAAVGQIDRALEQVQRAIERDYEHTEKMETDADLRPLQRDPRFSQLFVEWRNRRADLN